MDNKVGREKKMSIERVYIENYKSIKKCTIMLKQLNLIIGENGCGKTNALSAIKYFYDAMIGRESKTENIYDTNNKFVNQVKIAITYDCTELRKILVRKVRKANEENNDYYSRILNLISKDNKIYLELIKIKGLPIKWNLENYKDREIIYNCFPLYYVEAKSINFKTWNFIWEDIGDLLKLERNIEERVKEQLLDNTKEKTNVINKLQKLEGILAKSEVQIKSYTPKQYASMIAKLYFKGENFQISQYEPSYFSDGTNAFNYINTLIDIISIIKKNKIKFPIIVIDEPEISLHHKYIDKLSDRIIENNANQYILTTHSSRLLKNMLRYSGNDNNIIHLKYKNKYTICNNMKLFEDKRQNNVINDEHVNSYFSNMILLVEGESELQLFYNESLRTIYPILKNIDIVKAATDRVVKDGILPDKRKYDAPYLILIDMDKVMAANISENKFCEKKSEGYLLEYPKEKYYYGAKRQQTNELKKQIMNMMKKCKFHYILPFYACTDKNYYALIKKIKNYLIQHNVFVNSTTIEGLLVNDENQNLFWKYCLRKKKINSDLIEYYNNQNNVNQTNLLRLLVEGKTDYILNLKELDKIEPKLKKLIEENKISKKTEGWISDWINYYLCDILKIEHSTNSEAKLKSKLKKDENIEKCKQYLQNDFSELTNLIKEITKKCSN